MYDQCTTSMNSKGKSGTTRYDSLILGSTSWCTTNVWLRRITRANQVRLGTTHSFCDPSLYDQSQRVNPASLLPSSVSARKTFPRGSQVPWRYLEVPGTIIWQFSVWGGSNPARRAKNQISDLHRNMICGLYGLSLHYSLPNVLVLRFWVF